MGLFEITTLVFVILKLTGVIGWSWWWVLSPLVGGFLVGVGMGIQKARKPL
jgi:uncharacterized protein involved in exopolysaccharide biosynthesis